jgi:hypothetical protein
MINVKAGGFTLLFETKENEAILTGYEGLDAKLEIPASIEENGEKYYVTAIDKKAFLGCKGLRKAYLPNSVTSIGDWAFSLCVHLTKFRVRGEESRIDFGKNVFEGCERLKSIKLSDNAGKTQYLLAALVNKLPAPLLLRDKDLGSKAWYERFDISLKAFLSQEDIEGYSDRALCGEEDISYDGMGSVDGELLGESKEYLKEVGKNKSELCFLRLKNNDNLSKKDKEALEKYIQAHAFNTENKAAWFLLKEDYPDDIDYLKLYIDITNPSKEETDALLKDMGDKMAQAKAYLIERSSAQNKTEEFFDGLLL